MKKILPLLVILIIIGGCRKYDSEKATQNRADWQTSLLDSINDLTRSRSSDSLRLTELRENLATALDEFATVDNPREVEGYYILKTWERKYPLTSTGLIARLLKSEGLELIAASGKRFSAIRVVSGNESVESEIVPPDQALNYTANGLTTVAFTGAKADSIAQFVASHVSGEVKLEFLNPGVATSQIIPQPTKNMIMATWQLYEDILSTHRIEKSITINSRKIEILQLTLAREGEKK